MHLHLQADGRRQTGATSGVRSRRPSTGRWRRWSSSLARSLLGSLVWHMVAVWLMNYVWELDIHVVERIPSWF